MRLPLHPTLALGVGLAVWMVTGANADEGEPDPVSDPPHAILSVPAVLSNPGPSVLELGQSLPSAPDLAPVHSDPPRLDDVRRHLEAGDTRRALRAAEAFVEHTPWGRERDAAWLTIGLLHREAERPNLASEAFTRVRAAKGPLAPFGAWYEAEQDLERGREWVAIAECDQYRKQWPQGIFADACLRLQARAHAQLQRAGSARALAEDYDSTHPSAPISEQIELILAQRRMMEAPEQAVGPLQRLASTHKAPLTGRVAEELLAELREQGLDASVPDTNEALMSRAISLREVKRRDEAWAVFEELIRRSEDDPALARWVDGQAEAFGWRTHRWDFLADRYRAQYEASNDPNALYHLYRALDRGGRADEAATVALQGQKDHGNARQWRRKEEVIARTLMIAGRYPEATQQMDLVAARGGWTGRRASLYAAFCAHMAESHADAVERFDRVIERNASMEGEARYWRAKALDALERAEEAEADRQWLLTEDPHSWYAVLVRQSLPNLPQSKPYARDGSWPGAPIPDPPRWADARAEALLTPAPPIPEPVAESIRKGASGFGRLAWPLGGYSSGTGPVQDTSALTWHDPSQPPPSYPTGGWYNEEQTRGQAWRFVEANHRTWPELRAIHDLARAGLYDLSGPLMSSFFENLRTAYRSPRNPQYAAARQAWRTPDAWRSLFYFTRDHHHAARFTFGLWESAPNPELALEARKLTYPLAHDRYIWTHAREHGLDPYLVLGLMRQESTYNAIAVSHAGARGAMQIMPTTGHLLADLAHDTKFTAGDLEDPILSVGYGIRYLGLLMERFDGVYPLAIASYNGGPFNVSRWLAGTGADMPMDVFVEHIPFRETRDYVKKVTAGYASYLALYAPEPTHIALPETPRGDHPEVVDF